MSDPSPWIQSDYVDYLRHYDEAKRNGAVAPWFDPLDYETWLSRQTLAYLSGRGKPTHPVA